MPLNKETTSKQTKESGHIYLTHRWDSSSVLLGVRVDLGVIVFYSHDDINNNNDTGEHCRFWYERVYFFLALAFGNMSRERHK